MNCSKGSDFILPKKSLPKFDSRRTWKSVPTSKLELFEEIEFVDRSIDENTSFSVSVTVDDNLKPIDSKIARIDLCVPFSQGNPLNNGIERVKLACKVSEKFLSHEFNRRDAMRILLKRLKSTLRKKSKPSKKSLRRVYPKRCNETLSCRNRFFPDVDSEIENSHAKAKNDVVSNEE